MVYTKQQRKIMQKKGEFVLLTLKAKSQVCWNIDGQNIQGVGFDYKATTTDVIEETNLGECTQLWQLAGPVFAFIRVSIKRT